MGFLNIPLFLKDKVIGNAATFIAHIDPGPDAYDTCIEVLKEQYLDKPYIIDEYFKKLLSDKPEYDPTYFKTRTFIANTRNHLHNLKTHYGVDLANETHSAHKFLSHLIFSKFTLELRQAFKWELKEEYSTFSKILETYCKVTTQLGNVKAEKAQHQSASDQFSKPPHKSKYKYKNKSEFNFSTQVQSFTPHCRFCVTDGHNSVDCTTYATHQQRLDKCRELKLCTQCTSPNHTPGPLCPASKTGPGGLYKVCKYCSSNRHVAALCKNRKSTLSANVCLSSHGGQESNFLLPIISIKFRSKSGCVVVFNALFDMGSSRSYLNPRVAKLLEVGSSLVNHVDYEVKNFLECGTKK